MVPGSRCEAPQWRVLACSLREVRSQTFDLEGLDIAKDGVEIGRDNSIMSGVPQFEIALHRAVAADPRRWKPQLPYCSVTANVSH